MRRCRWGNGENSDGLGGHLFERVAGSRRERDGAVGETVRIRIVFRDVVRLGSYGESWRHACNECGLIESY